MNDKLEMLDAQINALVEQQKKSIIAEKENELQDALTRNYTNVIAPYNEALDKEVKAATLELETDAEGKINKIKEKLNNDVKKLQETIEENKRVYRQTKETALRGDFEKKYNDKIAQVERRFVI